MENTKTLRTLALPTDKTGGTKKMKEELQPDVGQIVITADIKREGDKVTFEVTTARTNTSKREYCMLLDNLMTELLSEISKKIKNEQN